MLPFEVAWVLVKGACDAAAPNLLREAAMEEHNRGRRHP